MASKHCPSLPLHRRLPLVFLLLLFFVVDVIWAQKCYSCSGVCHSDHCNCHFGACASGQCFIERTPTDESGVFRITKGCVRNPSRSPRLPPNCDFDHFSDHVLCVCQGDFCNENIYMRSVIRRNVTCRKCPERHPDCGQTCQGQWCHEDSSTGAAGCGYGPPTLPFFYEGPELLMFKNKMCLTITRAGPPRKHCICNTNYCNSYRRAVDPSLMIGMDTAGGPNGGATLRSRSLTTNRFEHSLPLQECFSCEVTYNEDQANTPSCKQHRCMGHFCTLSARRDYAVTNVAMSGAGRPASPFAVITERQACINVTDSSRIQLGCARKWMDQSFEELRCACKGHLCNRDLLTAFSSDPFSTVSLTIILLSLSYFTLN